MVNDNVYQPSGYFQPSEPVKQATEREDEIARTLAQLPVLSDEVEHLEARIAFYESVHSVPDEFLSNPEAFMHVITSNKLTAQNLTTERDNLIGRIKEASKE